MFYIIFLFLILLKPEYNYSFSSKKHTIIPTQSQKQKFHNTESFFGIFNEFVYESVLDNTNKYTETYHIKCGFGQSLISIDSGRMKTTVSLQNNFDINYVIYQKKTNKLMIEKKNRILTYISNETLSNIVETSTNKMIVFPEFQLREFIFSKHSSTEFLYLIEAERLPILIRAHKTKERFEDLKAILLEIVGIDEKQWKLIYYYNEYAWIERKEGYFNSAEPRYISKLKSKNNIMDNLISVTPESTLDKLNIP